MFQHPKALSNVVQRKNWYHGTSKSIHGLAYCLHFLVLRHRNFRSLALWKPFILWMLIITITPNRSGMAFWTLYRVLLLIPDFTYPIWKPNDFSLCPDKYTWESGCDFFFIFSWQDWILVSCFCESPWGVWTVRNIGIHPEKKKRNKKLTSDKSDKCL